jgi:CubicO group peptidase (beta-lactamase class C family)
MSRYLNAIRPQIAALAFGATFGVVSLTAPAQAVLPEDVGISSQRLERIEALVDRHIEAKSFSGAVTLVARDGEVVWLEAQGLMDLDDERRMPRNGIFRIMSMTKPVVGVATLMMMEEGKVRLLDPVSKFIPEWNDMVVGAPSRSSSRPSGGGPGAAPEYSTEPAAREVTVRDLLTHTSGVVSGPISNSANRSVVAGPDETLADYIPRLGDVPLEFQPGERWAYSAAAGFDVLSRIVEVVSGQPIDRFLQERLFDPLDMDDTTYVPPAGNRRLVSLYSQTPGGLQPADDPAFMNGIYFSGGGGLFTTATDYAQFAMMLANGGELDGERILSPRLVELMGSVFVPDSLPGRQPGEAFGLSVRVVNDPVARNTFLSKGSFGWSGLYGTHFWVDPKEKLVGIALTQTSNREFLSDFENMVMQSIVVGAE